MNKLIPWLEKLYEADSKARAVLRHSLAFDPGQHIPAFPYVEPFLKGEEGVWRRNVHYLVAGLWASHWREDQLQAKIKIAVAIGLHDKERRDKLGAKDHSKPTSTEKRFITLLDADEDQLPHRLRQMVALLGEQPIDFEALLNDLRQWKSDDTHVQITWARDFYRTVSPTDTPETELELETDE